MYLVRWELFESASSAGEAECALLVRMLLTRKLIDVPLVLRLTLFYCKMNIYLCKCVI